MAVNSIDAPFSNFLKMVPYTNKILHFIVEMGTPILGNALMNHFQNLLKAHLCKNETLFSIIFT